MLNSKEEKFVCPKCNRKFATKKGLTTHKTCCVVGRAKPNRKPQTAKARKNISNSLIGRKLSKEHVQSLKRSHPKLPRETRTCAAPNCDITFECVVESERLFCSHFCGNKYRESNIAKLLPREKRICPKCGGTFEVTIHCNQKFCTTICGNYYNHGKVDLPRLGITLQHKSSYEKAALFLFDKCSDVVQLEYEPIRISYTDDNGVRHKYVPDYRVTTEDGLLYLIEVKPEKDLDDNTNQLKFSAALEYVKKHNMKYLIWTEKTIFSNKNGSTTASLQQIAKATAATLLESGKVMIQSELHRNMQRQEETACPPTYVG